MSPPLTTRPPERDHPDTAEGHRGQRFAVAAEDIPALERRIASISRRAERAGSPGVALHVSGDHPDGDGRVWVELHGHVGPLGRWEVICILRHHEGAATDVEPLRPLPLETQEALRETRGHCEACRTVRPRAQTFLVRERSTGRTAQLGSSCVRGYTGAENPEVTLRQAEAVAAASLELTAASRARHASAASAARDGDDYIDTVVFLAHAAACVRSRRFVAASAPADAGEPTWRAARALTVAAAASPAAKDLQRAREIRVWAAATATQADDGTFAKRLAECVAEDRLTSRELALAASAVPAYNRHLAREISARASEQQQQPMAQAPGGAVDTVTFLACAAAAVRNHGFVRASEDGDGDRPATWRVARATVAAGGTPAGSDLQRAHEIRRWAGEASAGTAPDSYEQKLAVALAADCLTPRDLPIAAAAVRNYNRHLARIIAARRNR